MRQTLAARLDKTHQHPTGFDYLRVALALSVIVLHTKLTSYGDNTPDGYFRIVDALFLPLVLAVPGFFALSGFLVAGSLERSKTYGSYIGLRIFRVGPAFTAAVLLSALVLGPSLTELHFTEYFRNPDLASYFLNIVCDIHYRLPGLFETNPVNIVNGQFWTIPWELVCYISLAGLSMMGIFARRYLLALFLLVFYAFQIFNLVVRPNPGYVGPGVTTLGMCFLAGLVIYRFRDRLLWSGYWFIAACACTMFFLVFVQNGIRLAAIPIAYSTIYLGLTNPKRTILLSGDYSYGLYLYGFPVQQAWMTIPSLRHWYWNMLLAVPSTFLVAICSWWLVERPVLSRKHVLKRLEAIYLGWRSSVDEPPVADPHRTPGVFLPASAGDE
jgi:peptidoglycan/LPS O-acetylase OafA/YrhL